MLPDPKLKAGRRTDAHEGPFHARIRDLDLSKCRKGNESGRTFVYVAGSWKPT